MLPHAFEGRLRGKYNLSEPSAWKALDRDARLHAQALSSIAASTLPQPGGVENAQRFDPVFMTFDQVDLFEPVGGGALGGDALGGDALGGDARSGDALGGDALGGDGLRSTHADDASMAAASMAASMAAAAAIVASAGALCGVEVPADVTDDVPAINMAAHHQLLECDDCVLGGLHAPHAHSLSIDEFEPFVCPLSFEVMQQPVRASASREVFDEAAINRYREDRCGRGESDDVSPTGGGALGVITEAPDVLKALRLVLRGQPRLPDVPAPPTPPPTPPPPRTPRARDIRELGAAHFRCLDGLRPQLENVLKGLSPPRIVVIGSESTGKSTLLERLAMMPLFPRARRTCTRVPIHLHLRRCAPGESHARMTVFDSEHEPPHDLGPIIAINNGWER
ncbi:hypothetical protein T492DRAFT_885971, partial [Pavlovales sp. CCMP2436]